MSSVVQYLLHRELNSTQFDVINDSKQPISKIYIDFNTLVLYMSPMLPCCWAAIINGVNPDKHKNTKSCCSLSKL